MSSKQAVNLVPEPSVHEASQNMGDSAAPFSGSTEVREAIPQGVGKYQVWPYNTFPPDG